MVCLGADTTDAIGDTRHLLGRSAHAELLKAAQFGDLEVGVGDFALFIEKDLDLAVAFKPGDGIYRNSIH